MKRIIKSTEVRGGNLSGFQSAFMREYNREPSFNTDEKSWEFHKVLKSDTQVTPWLISISGEYFVALQAPPGRRGSERVTFYKSNSKGKFKIDLYGVVEVLNLYVDLESACDEFAKIHYANKIREEELDIEMEISREAAEFESEKEKKETK
jgi:hypothetical protein